MHYDYDFHGRKRFVIAEGEQPLLCVTLAAEVFERVREASAEQLDVLRQVLETVVRSHVAQWQREAHHEVEKEAPDAGGFPDSPPEPQTGFSTFHRI